MVFKDKSFIEVFHKIQQAGGEVALVGGVVRNILLNEKFLSDNSSFDLATNLNPDEICKALEKKKINFYKTGYLHGTITANIGKINFEITSLREDIQKLINRLDQFK